MKKKNYKEKEKQLGVVTKYLQMQSYEDMFNDFRKAN